MSCHDRCHSGKSQNQVIKAIGFFLLVSVLRTAINLFHNDKAILKKFSMAKTKQEIHAARPMSPHLTIYKRQISSVLSIFHRLTGAGLFFMLSLATWWFIFFVFSRFCSCYLNIANYAIFRIILILTSFAGFYHLLNGIRHLFWDMGKGFSIKAMNQTGIAVVFGSILLTLLFWLSL